MPGVGNAAASLSVTTSNDAVTQTADAFVAGATVVDAGTADVTLARPGNDFQGTVSLTGGALSVRDANSLNITVLANDSDKSIIAIAGGTLAVPAGGIDADAGDLVLQSLGGALTTPGVLTAQNITLVGSGGLTLANNVTATGNLSLGATNNAIAQSGGSVLLVAGTTTAAAGSGAVTLNTATNQMAGAVSSTGTGAVTLFNGRATQLGAIGASGLGNAAASLSVTTSNDAVSQTADAFVAGATVVNAGTAELHLPGPATTSRERSRSPAAPSASATRTTSTSPPWSTTPTSRSSPLPGARWACPRAGSMPAPAISTCAASAAR